MPAGALNDPAHNPHHPAHLLKISGKPDHRAALHSALGAVAQTHKVRGIPPIKLDLLPGGGAGGKIGGYTPDGGITVRGDAKFPEMTAVHEIGHWLDRKMLSTDGKHFGYRSDPHMTALRTAIEESPTSRALVDLASTGKATIQKGNQLITLPSASPKHAKYLSSRTEQFARAYAQYVAHKSQHPALLKAIKHAQASSSPHTHLTAWGDEEFKPIAAEFDRLFAERGLHHA